MFIQTPPFILIGNSLIAVSLLWSASVQADSQLVYRDSLNGVTQGETQISITQDKVRVEKLNQPLYTIYQADKSALYTINPLTEQFTVTTIESVQQQAKALLHFEQDYKDQLKQQINELPEPEQAPILKRMRQAEIIVQLQLPKPVRHLLDTTQNVNGHKCRITQVQVNELVIREICNSLAPLLQSPDYEALQSMHRFIDTLSREAALIRNRPSPSEQAESIHQPHLALSIKTLPSNMTSELLHIRQTQFPAQYFIIPSHYKALEQTLNYPQ